MPNAATTHTELLTTITGLEDLLRNDVFADAHTLLSFKDGGKVCSAVRQIHSAISDLKGATEALSEQVPEIVAERAAHDKKLFGDFGKDNV